MERATLAASFDRRYWAPIGACLCVAWLVAACSSGSDASISHTHTANNCAGSTTEVQVDTGTGKLAGTLRVPSGCDARPLVVIFAGSGATDRDGNDLAAGSAAGIPGGLNTDAYKQLANVLSEHGIASVRYDKRGVGASSEAIPADISAFTVDDAVADAKLWAEAYAHDPRFSELILAGHSEGSLFAILIAQQLPVTAVISLAGAGRPLGDVLREQIAAQAGSLGVTPELLEQAADIISSLEAGMKVDAVPPVLNQLFDPAVQAYLISMLKYNPAVEIAKLDVPILVVQGTTDIQVKVTDGRMLAAANPLAQLLEIDELSHPLKAAPADQADQLLHAYSDPTLPLHPELVSGVLDFIDELASKD